MVFLHNNQLLPFDITSKDTPSGRIYSTPDGPLPSITTILSSEEKPAIVSWRNSLGEQEANKRTKKASDRGTAVHSMIEQYLNNEEVDFSKYDTLHASQFRSLRPTLNKITNVLAQEIPLWSTNLGVAGRVDCIAEYDGKISIIDFKTSTNDKSEDKVFDYYLQATAYAIMVYERYGIEIENIVILMAVENGLVPLVFKKQISPYVEPLIDRINTFYDKFAEKK